MAEQTRRCPCPRCGYDLSGVVDSWREQCPLEGVCSECGVGFATRVLFTAHRGRPFDAVYGLRRWTAVGSALRHVFAPITFWNAGVESNINVWRSVLLIVLSATLWTIAGIMLFAGGTLLVIADRFSFQNPPTISAVLWHAKDAVRLLSGGDPQGDVTTWTFIPVWMIMSLVLWWFTLGHIARKERQHWLVAGGRWRVWCFTAASTLVLPATIAVPKMYALRYDMVFSWSRTTKALSYPDRSPTDMTDDMQNLAMLLGIGGLCVLMAVPALAALRMRTRWIIVPAMVFFTLVVTVVPAAFSAETIRRWFE